jgi:hypothetical protein
LRIEILEHGSIDPDCGSVDLDYGSVDPTADPSILSADRSIPSLYPSIPLGDRRDGTLPALFLYALLMDAATRAPLRDAASLLLAIWGLALLCDAALDSALYLRFLASLLFRCRP